MHQKKKKKSPYLKTPNSTKICLLFLRHLTKTTKTNTQTHTLQMTNTLKATQSFGCSLVFLSSAGSGNLTSEQIHCHSWLGITFVTLWISGFGKKTLQIYSAVSFSILFSQRLLGASGTNTMVEFTVSWSFFYRP